MPRPVDIPADQFVALDGIRFHYLDWGGDGEPLLLLAGLGCTAHVFAELAPHLGDRFRVVALTRRGHGLTEQVGSGHALATAADDASRLLDTLDIERVHVAGHSMGGGEASALAARHPGRVAKVVYLDGAYDWADRPAMATPDDVESPESFASYEHYVTFMQSLLPDGIWGPAMDTMMRTCVESRADGSVVDKLSDAAFAPFVRALNDFRHPYSDISAPALAIYAVGEEWDEEEAEWRVACRERFAAEIPGGQVMTMQASHYLFFDRRDAVLTAMRQFLT